MKLQELYNVAEGRGIPVTAWHIDNRKAAVLRLGAKYHIIMDYAQMDGARDERIVLAHELGHCRSGRLYCLGDYSNPLFAQNIAKAERKACDEACKLLVHAEEIKKALRTSDTEYAAAESLDLDVKTFIQAVNYYRRKGMLEDDDADDHS